MNPATWDETKGMRRLEYNTENALAALSTFAR